MDGLFPFEFFLEGTPRSLQARHGSLRRWKEDVIHAARSRIEQTVDLHWIEEQPLALTIYYFPDSVMLGDVDNIVKPIMDALEGVAYRNDSLVERVVVQKFEPGKDWFFAEPSEQLAGVVRRATPEDRKSVVYVRVDNDLSWRRPQ